MAVNWYLIAQLDGSGILLLCLYLGLTTVIYSFGCAPNSVGHIRNWSLRGAYQTVHNSTVTTENANSEDDNNSRERELRDFSTGTLSADDKNQLTRTNSL